MFDGYLTLGQTELLNAQRTRTYAQTLLPTMNLAGGMAGDYDTIAESVGDADYTNPVADNAPWISPDDENTHRFYGLFPQSEENITSSTLAASVTERVDAGGVVNTPRDASRDIPIRAVMIAEDELALEAGKTWLRNMLAQRGCLVHEGCETSDLQFFIAKPDPDFPEEALRHYNGVECTVGMEVVSLLDTGDCGVAQLVEFTLTAENPYQYSEPVDVGGAVTIVPGGLFSDSLLNLILYPDAEKMLESANFVLQPSAESGIETWGTWAGTGGATTLADPVITTPYGTRVGRVTWTAPTTAAGGGVFAIAKGMPKADVADYQVNFVRSSITTRLKLRVEFVSAAGVVLSTNDGAEFVATAGVIYNPKLKNTVTPPGSWAPGAGDYARVGIVSVAGTSFANWSTGSYLEVDALMASYDASTTTVRDYYAGSTNWLSNDNLNPSFETNATGYTAIPGTTGAVAAGVVRTVSATAFGTAVGRATWTTASTAAGGGIQYGNIRAQNPETWAWYVGHVKSSINQRLKLRIAWYTIGDVFISNSDGPEVQFVAGVPQSLSLVAAGPATAYSGRMTVISVAGTGYANWSIGSYLEVDGLMATHSDYVPAYFDKDTPADGDFFYGTTTAFTTQAFRKGRYIDGWTSSLVTGGTGASVMQYRTVEQKHDGLSAARTLWLVGPTADTTEIIGGPTMAPAPSTPSNAIYPGQQYQGSIWVRPSKTQRLLISCTWLDQFGAPISTMSSAAASTPGAAWARLSVGGAAPAGAVAAQLYVSSTTGAGYTRWVGGDYIDFDSAMLTIGNTLVAYFDGSTVDAPPYYYDWEDASSASISLRSYSSEVDVAELVDPDLPVLPTPPVPPAIPNDAIVDQNEWVRYSIVVPVDDVPLWAGGVPIVTLSTDTDDVRQVRVRFYPNPDNLAPENLIVDQFETEFILSYLPSNSVVVVDSVTQTAYADTGSGPLPADQLLYGTGGAPMVWGELSGGVPYVMTVDILPTTNIANLDVSLALARRE